MRQNAKLQNKSLYHVHGCAIYVHPVLHAFDVAAALEARPIPLFPLALDVKQRPPRRKKPNILRGAVKLWRPFRTPPRSMLEDMIDIPAPSVPPDDQNRHLLCQMAIEIPLQEIIEAAVKSGWE
jgi:hypothetical protein